MIVGDGRLAREDRVAAGDLVEGVDRKRRGAVRGRQQVGVDAQRRARPKLVAAVLVDAMRPDDLLGRGHAARRVRVRKVDRGRAATDRRNSRRPTAKMPPLRRISSSFGESGTGVYVFPCVTLASAAGRRIEREFIAVAGVGDRLGTLHDVQAEVERIAPEDVAHVLAADDHHLEAGFFGDALESGRAHLARGADREPVAGNQERLAACTRARKSGMR